MTNSGSTLRPIATHARDRRGLAGSIRVRFKRDSVSVSGTLRRWTEKDAVLALLRHAPGVRRIDDHIVVKTSA
jgi:hypothetical protein